MRFSFDRDLHRLLPAAEYLSQFRHRGQANPISHLGLTIYRIRNCLYLGSHAQAILPLQAHGALPYIFTESCPYLAHEPHLPSIVEHCLDDLKDLPELDEAVPLFPPGADNLWHWTTESLPILLAMEAIGYAGPYIVPQGSPVPEQCFSMFGIPARRLLPGAAAYHIRNILLPQRLSGFSLPENMPLTRFLRAKMLEAAGSLPGAKRCYIRRTGRRRILNEEDLLAVLQDFAFKIMTPETLSLAAQWQYMSNVECSIMAHGANSTLILLQKPSSGCIELFSNRYVSYNNMHAVRLLRLRYYPLVEELNLSCALPDNPRLFPYLQNGLTADITADLWHVRIALESLLC
ncbi:MAG: glycosyltransferase family 61 protein [Desulfovibrio sp.]|jgi:capsular polysaccharide biosynthesis protein|nr:glycosyltransferase family 61 protein [Desulfovibrio sp.]